MENLLVFIFLLAVIIGKEAVQVYSPTAVLLKMRFNYKNYW